MRIAVFMFHTHVGFCRMVLNIDDDDDDGITFFLPFIHIHSFLSCYAVRALLVVHETKNQIIIVYIMIVGYVCPFTFHACLLLLVLLK